MRHLLFLMRIKLPATTGMKTEKRPFGYRGGVRAIRSSAFAGLSTGAPIPRGTQAGAGVTDGAVATEGYRMPSKAITSLLDTPTPPSYSFSPDRTKVLKIGRPPPHPPLSEFMREEQKLAGVRLDADLMARVRLGHSTSISLLDYAEGVAEAKDEAPLVSQLLERPLQGVPEGMVFNYIRWSPDGGRFAFTLRSAGAPDDPPRLPLALHTAEPSKMVAEEASGASALNATFEDFVWVTDDEIIASVVPEDVGERPQPPAVPVGPKISDNASGRTSKARTYPDLLKNEHDAALFEWLSTSSLVLVDLAKGTSTQFGPPRMYISVDPSPNSEFFVVSWVERPFSYELPVGRFPRVWQVWDRSGKCVHEICRLPLLDSLPIEFDATRTGPRSINWRSDAAATLKWVEAQDGGDPKRNPDVAPRDIVYALDLSKELQGQQPVQLCSTDFRYGGIAWCDDDLALLYESHWDSRKSRTWIFAPGDPMRAPKLLFDRNFEDIYTDPGNPVGVRHAEWCTTVLARVDGEDKLLMEGEGSSPEGNRPFLEVLDLATAKAKRIWQSSKDGPAYEAPAGTVMNEPRGSNHISLDNLQMLFTKETPRDPPQFYIKTFTENGAEVSEVQLTDEPHPFPELRDMQRDILRYKRNDGVELHAELFTPPGYDKDKDGRLPCLLWAYPKEYKSKDAAGQMDASPFEFSGLSASSPLVWLAKGWAVLSGPSMPIIAEGAEEPNDTYVPQLVASGEAAVIEVVFNRGVADPDRIAVGGHSYGAFMAANLLAHAGHLFACGVAQSGAYNRTLTPFGFQAEQRTFWDAPEVYGTMAPFNNADKIKKPLLLVHGEADNNTGTFPLQSERMFAALQGHGCKTRLVVLPHESHGYRAHESVMHVLAEKESWFEAHCGEKQLSSEGENGSGAQDAKNDAAATPAKVAA